MKTIQELKYSLSLYPSEVSNRVSYIKSMEIDFDVYLPSLGINLQRDLVWSELQKEEIIHSILLNRHIPHISYINAISLKDGLWEDKLLIIDGKQRLNAIFDYMDDKFKITLEGNRYYFSQLPDDYQRHIKQYHLRSYVVNEEKPCSITDKDKIEWFKFLNFSGTPQDKEHLEKLDSTVSLKPNIFK